jgi:hypothetical protein
VAVFPLTRRFRASIAGLPKSPILRAVPNVVSHRPIALKPSLKKRNARRSRSRIIFEIGPSND